MFVMFFLTLTLKGTLMPKNQIERLKNDSRQLDNYIHRLRKRGKDNLAHKITMKREYLNQTINEYEQMDLTG
jgi:hypothetical protein